MQFSRGLCGIAFLLVCRHASAADGYGNISGTVFDPDGRPAPLASVNLIQQETGLALGLVTDQDGKYQAARVPAGLYKIVADSAYADGSVQVSVTVRDNQDVNQPIHLAPLSPVFVSGNLLDVPLNGRNYLDLTRTGSEATFGQEGGNIDGYTPYSSRGNSAFNAAGMRGQENNFQIDGIDNNDIWTRGAALQPSIEAISSVSVDSPYVPASAGRAAGGVLSVQTRSGGNQFHGDVFDYLQNSALDAKNFFDGASKPGLVQNQFGGSVGGPVRKNNWFFFVDSELTRGRRGLTVISTVPTATEKSGGFGASTPVIYDPNSLAQAPDGSFFRLPFQNNSIPLTSIPLAARNLIALYPNPNLPGLVDNYRFTPSSIDNDGKFDARTDKVFSASNTMFARFSYEHQNADSPGSLPAPAGMGFPAGSYAGSDSSQNADNSSTSLTALAGAASYTFVVSPTIVNELRAGITRFDLSAAALDQGLNASSLLAIPGLSANGLPDVAPTGYAQLGAAEAAPFNIKTTSYQINDSVLWRTHQHSARLGLEAIRRQADGSSTEWSNRGTYLFTPDYTSSPGVFNTGDPIASLLTGYPFETRRDVQFQPFQLRDWEFAGFVEDEFRVFRHFTIQVGVRYSMTPPVSEASNRMVNFVHSPLPALNEFAGQGGVNDSGGLNTYKSAIAPRIGIAWDIFGNGSTVLRGGFSKMYDTGAYISEGILAQNPPYASRLDNYTGSLQTGLSLSDGLPAPVSQSLLNAASLNAAHGSVYAVDPGTFTPYSDQWGVFLDQRLRPRLTLEASLTSSMGIHLFTMYDANQPVPTPTPFFYPRYPFDPYESRVEYLTYAAGSTYYGGQLKLAGQVTSGLQVVATYRYAKSIDDENQPMTNQDSRPGPQYLYSLRNVRSPSPFDIAQRILVTASYDLPFQSGMGGTKAASILHAAIANWRAGTVVTVQGGLPFTPQLATNTLNNGGIQLPNRVGSGALPADQQSYLRWFNTSLNPADPNHAFVVPGLYQYGTSGYDFLRGPGLATVDASLARTFALRERMHLQVRLEAFNLLNRVNLALPNRMLDVVSSGAIDHTATPPRQMEVVARVEW